MFGLVIIINVNRLSKEMNRNMANGVHSELRLHIPRLTEWVGCPVGWNLQPWVQGWETVELLLTLPKSLRTDPRGRPRDPFLKGEREDGSRLVALLSVSSTRCGSERLGFSHS
ncbi:hypothetical protein CY34DRAFT_810172 [Suillus luteus UH-Slu-Lm8-n1]|uniref:Uncharacterized protein n=1 Tax=Suillus luteus UH-Slu-Lm8-n1 TaxID=930992 RepID=A0A0D0ATK3_9AGAM|nr:hypothetical protein CY34DRAFT_810172 [Suillus luteus UH-Slu-Lm8-n1]